MPQLDQNISTPVWNPESPRNTTSTTQKTSPKKMLTSPAHPVRIHDCFGKNDDWWRKWPDSLVDKSKKLTQRMETGEVLVWCGPWLNWRRLLIPGCNYFSGGEGVPDATNLGSRMVFILYICIYLHCFMFLSFWVFHEIRGSIFFWRREYRYEN